MTRQSAAATRLASWPCRSPLSRLRSKPEFEAAIERDLEGFGLGWMAKVLPLVGQAKTATRLIGSPAEQSVAARGHLRGRIASYKEAPCCRSFSRARLRDVSRSDAHPGSVDLRLHPNRE
jgi:hypothetical protein